MTTYQNLEDNDQFTEDPTDYCDCGTILIPYDFETQHNAEHKHQQQPDKTFCSQHCLDKFLKSKEGQHYQTDKLWQKLFHC